METSLDFKQRDESPMRLGSGSLDRAFITDLLKANKEVNLDDKIKEYYKLLRSQVSMLDTHIDTVLQKHEQDFLNAFKCQMFALYGQLKELKKKNDENEIRLKRDEQLNSLKKSLDWFREEAIKLGESNQFFKKEADKWKARAETLQDDRNFLENQLKKTKRKLKLLQLEKKEEERENGSLKSSNLANSFNIQNFSPCSKTGEIIEDLYSKFNSQGSFFFELEKFFNDLEVKYNDSIRHLKNSLEGEKKKIKQVTAQQSSTFFVKSDLENLFLECVEEVRKEISRRKAKNLVEQKYQKRSKTSQREERLVMTPSDKRKILELLISNEQVLILLYEKLFPHRASQFTNLPKPENKGQEEALPNLEELLRQVPTRPNIPKTWSFPNRGRSVI